MTDYKEEQRNEIEALQSIYPDEIEIISEEPYHIFKLVVQPQDAENFPDHAMSAVIMFTYTENYPDTAPIMEFDSTENMDDSQQDSLMEFMKSQAEENLGMAMIFTIISAVQERMTSMMEQAAKDEETAAEKKKTDEEEAERKRFEGTRVTVESFMAWKLKFDAEMQELRRLRGLSDNANKKPTEGDTLEVDESLFENLEDLEIEDDDDEDDPDYKPGYDEDDD